MSSITVAEQVLLASMKARMPAVLVGPPGVGKTAKLYELAKRMGYTLITLIGSQLDPTDIVGLPKGELLGKTEDGKDIYGTVNLSPWWQVEILLKKKVILFLDEMSNTSSATRASMLTMLQSREFPNGQKMPADTIVVGAMNPTEQAADGYDLDAPTTNRINFIVWAPSVEEWKAGMLKAWGKKVTPNELAWRQRVVRFIEASPESLQQLPDSSPAVENPVSYGANAKDPSEMEVFRYAWPSRRSWDNLSRVLAFTDDKHPVVQDTIAQGIVGYVQASKFRDWLKRNSKMSPLDLMENPRSIDWRRTGQDESTFLLRGVIDHIKDAKTSIQAIAVFEEIARQKMQGIGAGYMKELMSQSTKSSLDQDTIRANRQRLQALTQAYGKISSNM